jgi:hypothetical protein
VSAQYLLPYQNMGNPDQDIRVFIASPSDVSAERDAVAEVVRETNYAASVFAPEMRLNLRSLRWEDTYPTMGRPEQAILDQIGEYDIFVGIMCSRFGTPTGKAESGTEEEFRLAYEGWKHFGRPHIMVYFCEDPPAPKGIAEIEQLKKVYEFRDELYKVGLIGSYRTTGDFSRSFRNHLISVLGSKFLSPTKLRESAERVGRQALQSDITDIPEHIANLVAEYEYIRSSMPSSPQRTRRLEGIVTRLRPLVISVYSKLADYAVSPKPGERLVATVALQTVPDERYLGWLEERFGAEDQAFLQYHAGLALLAAGRVAPAEGRSAIRQAAQRAMTRLNPGLHTDRYAVLKRILNELE